MLHFYVQLKCIIRVGEPVQGCRSNDLEWHWANTETSQRLLLSLMK